MSMEKVDTAGEAVSVRLPRTWSPIVRTSADSLHKHLLRCHNEYGILSATIESKHTRWNRRHD